jgi:hypothetical protein
MHLGGKHKKADKSNNDIKKSKHIRHNHADAIGIDLIVCCVVINREQVKADRFQNQNDIKNPSDDQIPLFRNQISDNIDQRHAADPDNTDQIGFTGDIQDKRVQNVHIMDCNNRAHVKNDTDHCDNQCLKKDVFRIKTNSFLPQKEKQQQTHDCESAYLHLDVHIAFFSPIRKQKLNME